MMCEACTEGRHYACGLQTWCECDCDPNDPWSYLDDPVDDPENAQPVPQEAPHD